MTALGTTLVFEDQLRTAGYSEEAIKAAVKALTNSMPARVLEVEQRAVALGCTVERNDASRPADVWLSIAVRRDGRRCGMICYWPAKGNVEEHFDLCASQGVDPGFPVQFADNLLENARVVREVYGALVGEVRP